MRLGISTQARRDLRDAVEYIAQDDAAAAERLEVRLHEAAARLADFPALGPALAQAEGLRVFSVSGTPFRLVYQVGADRLTILRIWHGARGWPPASS
ncbi:MAG: type II toxin-antitoxin system RelE/ParE family toxin [Paracraurococcus sp.]